MVELGNRGALEGWRIGVLEKDNIHLTITPSLHCPNTLESIENATSPTD